MRPVVLAGLLLVPLAVGSGIEGVAVCQLAGGPALCTRAMTVDAHATVGYTQQTLSCDEGCLYRPTARLELSTDAPGTWILRATTWSTHYPAGSTIAGSRRALECTATGPFATCTDAEVTPDVVGDGFNSARWHATWTLELVDATGTARTQGAWTGQGWLAQYCSCEG